MAGLKRPDIPMWSIMPVIMLRISHIVNPICETATQNVSSVPSGGHTSTEIVITDDLMQVGYD